MDVEIAEMNTTVRMMDSQMMLSPQVMEMLIRELMVRLKDLEQKNAMLDDGRELRDGASVRPAAPRRMR